MMRFFSSFSTLLFVTFAGFFLFMAWHVSGWSGTFKMLYLVALVPLAGLAVIWICRGMYWAVVIVLASIYMSIEFVGKQLLKLVFWK